MPESLLWFASLNPRSACVTPSQFFDRLVRHRRPSVRIEKRPRETLPEVVVQSPDPGGEVVFGVAEAGLPHVDQPAELAVVNQHVGQAVIAVDEHVASLTDTEWTADRGGGVKTAQDLAQLRRHTVRRPTDGWVVHRDAGHDVRDEPVVARLVKESRDPRHRPPARQPAEAVALAGEVCRPLV